MDFLLYLLLKSDVLVLITGKIGGCPFMGEITGFGNLNKFFSKLSKRMGNVNIWKMYFFGRPSAVRIET